MDNRVVRPTHWADKIESPSYSSAKMAQLDAAGTEAITTQRRSK